MNPSEIPPEILNLSVTARLELVGKIWDSIAEEGLPPLTQKQRELLDERISEADLNPRNRIPASTVFHDARRLN
jgi:putative addiction module component (TIGR02574 family)